MPTLLMRALQILTHFIIFSYLSDELNMSNQDHNFIYNTLDSYPTDCLYYLSLHVTLMMQQIHVLVLTCIHMIVHKPVFIPLSSCMLGYHKWPSI